MKRTHCEYQTPSTVDTPLIQRKASLNVRTLLYLFLFGNRENCASFFYPSYFQSLSYDNIPSPHPFGHHRFLDPSWTFFRSFLPFTIPRLLRRTTKGRKKREKNEVGPCFSIRPEPWVIGWRPRKGEVKVSKIPPWWSTERGKSRTLLPRPERGPF